MRFAQWQKTYVTQYVEYSVDKGSRHVVMSSGGMESRHLVLANLRSLAISPRIECGFSAALKKRLPNAAGALYWIEALTALQHLPQKQ